ncbi:uncharacterized protein LOC107018744 [Solanum pennellii]|uniref:Uncharacterized protein LOC107018744 n=1 Tax=Solanum pennellii TaxID=28526 RepID=A0ABM1GRD0_SOLPN|nr:uncharacterized protein LOC107018744 [Solanum pennellii]
MSELIQPIKRFREEEEQLQVQTEEYKRHKSSYNDILSILEEEEEYGIESDPDIKISGSDIFTTLQQELDLLPSDNNNGLGSDPVEDTGSGNSQIRCNNNSTEDDRSSVIRHLLEASDDELGIPSGDGINGSDFPIVEENGINGGDFPFAISDGLWELEDEAANYYSLLQSELFM